MSRATWRRPRRFRPKNRLFPIPRFSLRLVLLSVLLPTFLLFIRRNRHPKSHHSLHGKNLPHRQPPPLDDDGVPVRAAQVQHASSLNHAQDLAKEGNVVHPGDAHEPMPITVEEDKSAHSKAAARLMDLSLPSYSSSKEIAESSKDRAKLPPLSADEPTSSSISIHHNNPFEAGNQNNRDEHGALIDNDTHQAAHEFENNINSDVVRSDRVVVDHAQPLGDDNDNEEVDHAHPHEDVEIGNIAGHLAAPIGTENNRVLSLTHPVGVHEPQYVPNTIAGERATTNGAENAEIEHSTITTSNIDEHAPPVVSENNTINNGIGDHVHPPHVHEPEQNSENPDPAGDQPAFVRFINPDAGQTHSKEHNGIRDVTDEVVSGAAENVGATGTEPEPISMEADGSARTITVESHESREVTNEASGAAKYSAAGFPHFYVGSRRIEPWNTTAFPDSSGRIGLEFHLTRAGCANSGIRNGVYEVTALAPAAIDVADPPISLVGTSATHSREIKVGSVSELVAHMAVWREVFVFGVNFNVTGRAHATVLADGVSLDTDIHTDFDVGKGAEFDMVFLENRNPAIDVDPFAAYVLSVQGANKLLSLVTEFTVPLPELVGVLARRHGLKVVRIPTSSLKKDNLDCTAQQEQLRDMGSTIDTASLPYYPPHHPFFDIIDQ